MPDERPSSAKVVIVGGGIIGASIAYHLTKQGCRDVVVVERHQITSGTTWHAAGLVMQLRSSHALTELCRYGAQLYSSLEEETGQATGFIRRGSLHVARNEERMVELKRLASLGRRFDVATELIDVGDIRKLHPLADPELLTGALFIPGDGQTNPVDTTMALVKGAKAGGAKFVEGLDVTGFDIDAGMVKAVKTSNGTIACEYAVNCAGVWARDVGRMAGVRVPIYAAEHMYVTTAAMDGLADNLPVLRDADGYVYVKEDAGKLLIGCFEPEAKALALENLPTGFEFGELQEDWDQFALPMSKAIKLVPALENAEIRHFMNGPESFTPDNRFILGEAPEVRNFFVAAGFNSQGILSGAGVGRAMAEWILNGSPTLDLAEVDIARFHPFQSNQAYLHERTKESVGLLYAMHWPHRQVETARPVRLSPLHFRLQENNACFGEAAGWERANWFAQDSSEAHYKYSYGRQNWFENVAREHQAVRDHVGMFDMSSFAKIEIRGADAEFALQHICSADVAVPAGKTIYTLMLNKSGGIEADVTLTKLESDRYLMVAPATMQSRILAWLQRNTDRSLNVSLVDATSAYGVLAVMGPKSRDLLSSLTPADLSNDAFPFLTSREIEIGYATVLAMRVTYVGELGWELYAPTEFMVPLFDAIVDRGKDFDLRLAGYHALDSLRSEKGYRHWGDDITPADRPCEAGLGFAVSRKKNEDFLGRAAAEQYRENPQKRRLLHFQLHDSEPILFRDELILNDGRVVGHISSGAYGYTLQAPVGMGYVDIGNGLTLEDVLQSDAVEIEIAGKKYAANATLRPLYDPDNLKVRT